MTELHELSARELRHLLGEGELKPSEVTTHYLERISALNPTVHALVTVTAEAAAARADELDRMASSETRPTLEDQPLWGMPFADKDLNDRAGVRTTYGSAAFENHVAASSSPIVSDMDAAGGISLGKTNVPEFGMPSYAENRLREGFPRNPWDLGRDPGGSSSGAAVAVATRLLPFAPGNDGGGSVRIPAAACGLVGLKPTRGLVPGEPGLGALAGLPTGGPLARTVEDAALLLDGMCVGKSRYALRALAREGNGTYSEGLSTPVASLRVGWNLWSPWAEKYEIEVDPEYLSVFELTKELLARLGHEVVHVQPRSADGYVDAFRAVWMAGAASLPLTDQQLSQVEPLTRWLVKAGRRRSAAELARALATLAHFETRIIEDYADYDVVITPALGQLPRPIGWYDQEDGDRNFTQQCQFTPFTSYLNVAGLPAISLPAGQTIIDGVAVPIGVQAIGRPGDEMTLLRLGRQLQEESGWVQRKAPEPEPDTWRI